MPPPRIFVSPAQAELSEAAKAGGAELVDDPTRAEGILWTRASDPQGLRETLSGSPARWVQLPFAGIELFFAAGAVDPSRVYTCAKGIYGRSTAEHALTLMLAAGRLLHTHARAKAWRAPGASVPERMLEGATVLVVGTGGIATALAPLLAPFEVRLLAANRSGRSLAGALRTVRTEALPAILPEADYVVIAAPLTPQTQNLFGPALLAKMKRGAWLINVARGGLVDHAALVDALREGHLGGAALDVTEPEPLPEAHPLWALPNVLITPHIANTWQMALPQLARLIERNVRHFAQGEPLEGLVDVAAGY